MRIQDHPDFLKACEKAADEIRENGRAILKENAFASHVTQEEKEAYVKRFNYDVADELEKGIISSFATWQHVNTVLTGECVPFFESIKHA